MAKTVLEVFGLTREYGKKENRTRALDGANLKVEEGEFVAIVGKSGSGKSTLLHLLGGVDKPTSGQILVEGEDLYKSKKLKIAEYRRRKVGIIYQFFNLLPILNVEENILLPAELDGKRIPKEKLSKMLEMLQLTEHRKKLPNQLSGGQQQRVAIGRALINEPSIVLADEPTGNLDSKNAEEVISLLEKSNRELGQTIIIITHDLEIAKRASRIITIEDGKIVADEQN